MATKEKRLTTIAFDADVIEDRSRREERRHENASLYSRRTRKSHDGDSIMSSRSKHQLGSQYGLAIAHRSLSCETSNSQAQAKRTAYEKKTTKPSSEKPSDRWAQADDHSESIQGLCQRYRTSVSNGLSSDAVPQRLRESGQNVLPKQKTNHVKKILGYVFGGFCSILWVGVIIFFLCWRPLGDPDPQPYNLGLAILIIIVILLQASFSAFQDWSTARTMNAILDMVPSDATVLRDGATKVVPTKDLVPGDIVTISIGDKVPADLRLFETSGDTKFERSAMTGESEEVEASTDMTHENILESLNMAWMGTTVTNGSAKGLVTFTGERTVMGTIAVATTRVAEKPTAIQQEVTRFVRIIVGLTICLVCLILFSWLGWLRKDHPSFLTVVGMLNNIMGCVVAFIPEGMPVGVALTLMMVAKRMKAVNVLPKSLATVETLGCVQVICSDKTGTLTKNQMSVVSVCFADRHMTSKEYFSALASQLENKASIRQYQAARLCNSASFCSLESESQDVEREVQGNPTDCALLRHTEAHLQKSEALGLFPQIAQIPFNSTNKFMITLHQVWDESSEKFNHLCFIKGAPDVLLSRCSRYWSHEEQTTKALDSSIKEELQSLQNRMSSNAERVILLCEKNCSINASVGSNELPQELLETCQSDLTVIGMLGILDPPRPETKTTVADCRRAGIRFFMMTGDFGLTGMAIAKQVGIFTGDRDPDTSMTIESRMEKPKSDEYSNHSLLLEGDQIGRLGQEDWDLVSQYEEIVFARCSPEHKLTIINELKKRGFSTAVTGDGINDAPAMKAADVGIAMVNGSDVALEAAHLVLLDEFSSIVDGIRLGRLVFQNLQKVISYLLPAGSWSEIWPVLLNVFFGVPLPLSSFLMIIICVFTDLFCSLSLIMEKEEFDLLSLPPRNRKKEHLINLKIYTQSYLFIGVLETICAHAMFFLYYWRAARIPIRDLFFLYQNYTAGFHGYTAEELTVFNTKGQSVYFITLVILQWGNILSIRNKRLSILQADPFRQKRRNPWLLAGMAMSLAIAIFVTEVPGIQTLFGTGSAPIEFWFIPLPLALGILFMDELRKVMVRTWPSGPIAKIAW